MIEEKKYTKEQITKAIKYWSRVLERIDEVEATKKSNAVVDGLIAEFGYDLVTNTRSTYRLNDEDLEKIFLILNRHLFENKLKKPFLRYLPEQNVVNRINDNIIASEVFENDVEKAKCYGVFLSAALDDVNSSGKTIGVHFADDQIIINSTYLTKCVFIFAVASICHEMIHYYRRTLPGFDDQYFKESVGELEPEEPHDNEVFEQKMDEAKKYGINVIKGQGHNETYFDMNFGARNRLASVIGEKDNNNTIIVEKGGKCILRTKGSRKSCLIYFD